ncbi:MAG: hypothetical protein AAB323_01400 [Pseudomonadota bacterium]
MGRPQSDLFLIFKEICVQDRPYLDLDKQDDFKLFVRILKIMECNAITLDYEQQSRILVRIEYLKYLQQNQPSNEDERLLKNYFMQCDENTYDVI